MPGAARPDAVEHARHPRFVIGDEDERGSSSEASTSQDVPPAREPASILRARRPTLKQDKVIGSGCGEKVDPKKPERTAAPPPWLKDTYSWIRPHLDWKGMRPVLRSSAAAWCSLLLLLIDSSREALGQGAFLVLVVAAISPANVPIVSMLEMKAFQILLVSLAWAWGSLGMFIAHQARSRFQWSEAEFLQATAQRWPGVPTDQLASQAQVDLTSGIYLEGASSAVCCIFLGVGGGFFLWLRGHVGPGPVTFGTILGPICLAVMTTIGVLAPYPYYMSGWIFFFPFICQTAIAIAVTFVVLPETLAHQFIERATDTLRALRPVIAQQKDVLATDPSDDAWIAHGRLRDNLAGAKAKLGLAGLCEASFRRDLTVARVSGKDLGNILAHLRVLVSRANSFVMFHGILEKHLHRSETPLKGGHFVDNLVVHIGAPSERSRDALADAQSLGRTNTGADSPSRSRPNSRPSSLHGSRPPSPEPGLSRNSSSASLTAEERSHRGRVRNLLQSIRSSRDLSAAALLPHPSFSVKPIGLLEHARYEDLEDFLSNPDDGAHITNIVSLLSESSRGLLDELVHGLDHLVEGIHRLKLGRFRRLLYPKEDLYRQELRESEACLESLRSALETYRDTSRLKLIEPFVPIFDPRAAATAAATGPRPSHRGLFWALIYEFAILGWAETLSEALQELMRIERKRQRPRVWLPHIRYWRQAWSRTAAETSDQGDTADVDPDVVPGFQSAHYRAARNPDYLPPEHVRHWLGEKTADGFSRLFARDVLYGVKCAILLSLLSLPVYFPSTVEFFTLNRGIWVIVIASLTLNQFVGDTVFGFFSRVAGTVVGGCAGLVLWYIGSGTGPGNPYGIGAACAVGFPILFFYRVYYPSLVNSIVSTVTAVLIIGYSWQTGHSSAGVAHVGGGWPVAWRRFVTVLIGCTAAFLWAFLPPRTTHKQTIRKSSARVIRETGTLLCQILSFAMSAKETGRPPRAIMRNFFAVRQRLLRVQRARANVRYEIAVQGPWPEEQYVAIQTLSMEIIDSLGQLLLVFSSLEVNWRTALLKRIQVLNERFLSDLLSTFKLLSHSLTQGTPLPSVFHPLLDRFLRPAAVLQKGRPFGFEISLDDEEIPGVPKHIDVAVLSSLPYMRFAVGVSFAYAIVNRLDRLMLVAKSLVGEDMIVYGYNRAATSNPSTRPQRRRASIHVRDSDTDDDEDDDDGDIHRWTEVSRPPSPQGGEKPREV